jgi:hypothetical protein
MPAWQRCSSGKTEIGFSSVTMALAAIAPGSKQRQFDDNALLKLIK